MRLVFLGSPAEVLSPLEQLREHCFKGEDQLVGIVSQPARPSGRKQVLTDPPVAQYAKQHGIPLLQPEKARDPSFLQSLHDWRVDLMITAAYGQILSDEFLQIPSRGTINIHPSLLPQYRGATPVPQALLDGQTQTGVTILFTVKALDAGAIILQKSYPIAEDSFSGQLTLDLFAKSGELLLEALRFLRDPQFKGQEQDPSRVSFCKKIQKTDGQIIWGQAVDKIFNAFRAYKPWPGSYCFWQDQRVVIEELSLAPQATQTLQPGHFRLDRKAKALLVGTGSGQLWLHSLKPAGSKSLDALSFWNGSRLQEEGVFH